MLHAAFFRNVNLGRPNCPTRAQLEAAFLDSGAASASSFLVNGTLVFACVQGQRPREVAARARGALSARCGLGEPVFVRSVESLAELVARRPFDGIRADGRDTCCVTFLASHRAALPAAPFATPRGEVEFLEVIDDGVLSVARLRGANIGSPNAVLERLLDAPATTRAWRTIERLVSRHSRADAVSP
jgi:uncharacterized protein (DUF1697 family)